MIGFVSQIWTNVAEIKFQTDLDKIQLEQALTMHQNTTVLVIKKILDANTVRAIVIAKSQPIAVGHQVVNTLTFLQVPVGPTAKNQVFNILAQSQNNTQYKPKTIPINSTVNVTKENFNV
ncbi:F0F1 ATP synthase subunit beta, partial [Mesomycoplasma ovipneumoniae]